MMRKAAPTPKKEMNIPSTTFCKNSFVFKDGFSLSKTGLVRLADKLGEGSGS